MNQPGPGNHLFYGDNLDVLRAHVADESVDLIYLDPPFNSNADYNALFRTPSGKPVPAQEDAFRDTWQWDDTVSGVAVSEVKKAPGHQATALMLDAMVGFLGKNALTAYLAMMAVRLVELHRVLKPTGSLYLHCDPTASHYLKLLLDAVFGGNNYVNEISWRRQTAKADYRQGAKHFPRVRDVIFRYRRSSSGGITFNQPFTAYDASYITTKYRHRDLDGRLYRLSDLSGPGGAAKGNAFYEVMGVSRYWRYSKEKMSELIEQGRIVQTKPGGVPQYKRYLDEMPGVPCSDDWNDIDPINSQAQERLGYPTQKPVALLERIIAASSNPGDTVLDPFCGCGTTVHAAQKLGRRWIGIDITHVAIGLIETRLRSAFPGLRFTVHGTPMDLDAARDFFLRDDKTKKEFEKWAVTRIGFLPQTKKGADGGLDGMRWFGPKDERKAIVSVKGGKAVSVETVRSLDAVVRKQGAEVGVLLSLEEPTQAARDWARQGGLFDLPGFQPVPRLQVVTVAEALEHRERAVRLPALAASAARTAPREAAKGAHRDLFG